MPIPHRHPAHKPSPCSCCTGACPWGASTRTTPTPFSRRRATGWAGRSPRRKCCTPSTTSQSPCPSPRRALPRRARHRGCQHKQLPAFDDLDLILNLTLADFGELQPLADHPDHQLHPPSAEALPCATRLLSYRSCPPRPIFAHQGPFLLSKDHYFYVDHRMQRRFRVRRASRGLFFPTTVFLPTKVRFCPPRSIFAHQGPICFCCESSLFFLPEVREFLLSCCLAVLCEAGSQSPHA